MSKFLDWMIGNEETTYWGMGATALFCGLIAVLGILAGGWYFAFIWYIAATLFRLIAGGIMNRMGDAEVVNAWNDKYHRLVVIALNVGVGAALLGTLWWIRWSMGERYDYMRARWFLTIAIALYLVAQRFTHPNTFGARVRSATLTVVLVCTMANLAWGQHWDLWILVGVIALNFALLRLRALQRRFGWETR